MIFNQQGQASGGGSASTQSVTYDKSTTMYALLQTEDTLFPTDLVVGQTAYIIRSRMLKDDCYVTNLSTSANVPVTAGTQISTGNMMQSFTMPDAPVLVFCK